MKKMFSILVAFVFVLTSVFFGAISSVVKAADGQNKNVVVYFPNWGTYGEAHQKFSVDMIPWNKVTVINHSFFTVSPSFKLASIDEFADFQKGFTHSEGWDKLSGHFGEYKHYKTKYPNVKVLVSIGGWTRGENFHEMAKTKEGRAIFIKSLIDFLNKYTFIDGFDIDWEYPGIDRAKNTSDEYDRGCPGGPEDKENFTLLLKEIREAYNSNNMQDKILTIAVTANYKTLELQEPEKYCKYLDFMNVMTYDFHGAWEDVTNHHSPLYANPNDPSGTAPINIKEKFNVDSAVKTLNGQYGIPIGKMNIGTPLYSRGWIGVNPKTGENGMFANAAGPYKGSWDNPNSPGGQEAWFKLKQMENKDGWIKYRDKYNQSPWLYNKEKQTVLTYEDETSLDAKLDYINAKGLGGVIVWDISGDDANRFPMISMMSNKLLKNGDNPDPKPTNELLDPSIAVDKGALEGNYVIKVSSPANSTAKQMIIYENDKAVKNISLTENSSTEQKDEIKFENKENGKYVYKVEVQDAKGNKKSKSVEVNVNKIDDKGIDVKFVVTNDWETGANYNIIITNKSDKDINDWSLEFNFDKKITSIWDAKLSSNDNKYTITPNDWGKTIKKGTSVTLAGTCDGNLNGENIYNVKLNYK